MLVDFFFYLLRLLNFFKDFLKLKTQIKCFSELLENELKLGHVGPCHSENNNSKSARLIPFNYSLPKIFKCLKNFTAFYFCELTLSAILVALMLIQVS